MLLNFWQIALVVCLVLILGLCSYHVYECIYQCYNAKRRNKRGYGFHESLLGEPVMQSPPMPYVPAVFIKEDEDDAHLII